MGEKSLRRHRPSATALAGLLLVLGGCAVRGRLVVTDGCDCAAPERAATLGDYWRGRAAWRLVRLYPLLPGGPWGEGAHIFVHGGDWYLFSRKRGDTPPRGCPNGVDWMGTEVRRSSDRGLSWSPPATVVAPTPGTAWECAATDGDVAYDPDVGLWHYLFQCMSQDGSWNGCHVERLGDDPIGPWTVPASGGLAIRGGSLWRRICRVGSRCSIESTGGAAVVDEGTFNIFYRDGRDYYVSFHGFDGARGYRGVARTRDFATWFAGDPSHGTPRDAIFSAADTVAWRETWDGPPVGGGGGGILREKDGYFYMVVEAADRNLGCEPGQNWDVGLLRAKDLRRVPWEGFPLGNPIAYSSKERESACNPSYNRLFADGDERYWTHHRMGKGPEEDALYLYRLVASTNRLENGDLQRCDTQGWQSLGLLTTAPRLPRDSSHGGCFLDLQCVAGTCSGGEVFQEVETRGLGGRAVTFGGSFAADPGVALTLTLEQQDSNHGVISKKSLEIRANPTYSAFSQVALVARQAAFMRLGIHLSSPGEVRADELFLSPCSLKCPKPRLRGRRSEQDAIP